MGVPLCLSPAPLFPLCSTAALLAQLPASLIVSHPCMQHTQHTSQCHPMPLGAGLINLEQWDWVKIDRVCSTSLVCNRWGICWRGLIFIPISTDNSVPTVSQSLNVPPPHCLFACLLSVPHSLVLYVGESWGRYLTTPHYTTFSYTTPH